MLDISICSVRSMECSTSTIVVLLKLITSTLNTQIHKLKKPKKKKELMRSSYKWTVVGLCFTCVLIKIFPHCSVCKICNIVSKKISFMYFNIIKQLPTLTEGYVGHVYTFAFVRLLFRMLVFGSTKPVFGTVLLYC